MVEMTFFGAYLATLRRSHVRTFTVLVRRARAAPGDGLHQERFVSRCDRRREVCPVELCRHLADSYALLINRLEEAATSGFVSGILDFDQFVFKMLTELQETGFIEIAKFYVCKIRTSRR
jgi:hypothetical protein